MAKKEKEEVPSVYMNPLTDFGFKKLFQDKDLLIAFLNDVIGTNIKKIKYRPNEGLGEYKEERAIVFDLYCTTNNDEYFIVEMQMGSQPYFENRALFYAAHAIRKQGVRKKNWDYKYKTVYVVAILDFIIFKEKAAENEVIERVYLYRENGKKRFSDKLNFVFIELPKFKKQASELQNNTETWLFLLKNAFELETCPQEITGKVFKRFLEIAEVKHLTREEMETYKLSLKNNFYIRNMAKGERMEGEMAKSRQFVTNCAQDGMPIEKIALYTNLTKEQVQELLEEELVV